ncbi:MAG TPA: glycine cleavage T C-terminal barrel domain-containing protein, partial [Euzebya sp.]|nr:glycine cleavage T C-terminal barrel domain-containing protein [Euzebya sp.]
LGTIAVSGPDAVALLRRSFTNDVTALDVGRSQYTLCLDAAAGIIDDLLVYRLPDWYLVVPNAANTAAVTARLLDASRTAGADGEEADVEVAVRHLACVAVQGPDSVARLSAVADGAGLGADPAALDYLECTDLGEGQVLSRSGYTGEVGFEVFCRGDVAGRLWDLLAAEGVAPAGLGCRDTLRLEMGYPLHGNDISLDTDPVAAGLRWAVKPVGGAEEEGFVGEEAYLQLVESGPSHRLRGIRADGRRAPRAGDTVLADGSVLGTMTSGSFSPVKEAGIGLAYLAADVEPGTAVEVDVRGRPVSATVVKPPFVEARTR